MAGLERGSGPTGCGDRVGLLGLLGCGKLDVGLIVGFGCTGPRERSDRAKSGSDASRLIASDLRPEA